MATRRAFKGRRRLQLAEAQNWRCAYCSGVMLLDGDLDASATIDHIVPRRSGGTIAFANCVAACRACNSARGAAGPYRFWRLRRKLLAAGVWPVCSRIPAGARTKLSAQ